MQVVVENLAFGYAGSARLFEGVSFRLDCGETLAVVAPSGRGKSTLLQLLGGYLKPLQGTIDVGGCTADRPRPEVAWIFQNSTLLPHRSALDNVVLPLLARGLSRAAAESLGRELLARVGLLAWADRPARSLSGGEAQRVGVARGLLWPAELVLADEPTANLDRHNSTIIASAMYGVAKEAPVVVATHDPEVARGASQVLDLTDHLPAGEP